MYLYNHATDFRKKGHESKLPAQVTPGFDQI